MLAYSIGLFYTLDAIVRGLLDFGILGAFVIETMLFAIAVAGVVVHRRWKAALTAGILIYALATFLFSVFSIYVVMASVGFAMFIALIGDPTSPPLGHSLKTQLSSTRLFMVGLYTGGLIYALIAIVQEGVNFGTSTAVAVEVVLLIASATQGALDKKGLGVYSLAILLYVLFAFMLNALSEVVVMASGGLAVYAGLASEPKFPLTKRAIATGLVVGVIMTFLGIYLALKLGIVYFIGAELLGFLFLSIKGQYTPQENAISVAIANTSAMVSVGVLITFPAIAIFVPRVNPGFDVSHLLTFQFIALVTGLSAFFGILLLVPFRKNFENDPWPQVRPQAETINSLGGDRESKIAVLSGLAVSAAWVGTMKAAETLNEGLDLSSFPHAVMPAIPDWIGITNSPLMAAIGFFIGWKRVLTMAAGSIISILVWILLEGAVPIAYASHLTRPEILYLAIGIFVTVIAGDIFSEKKHADETSGSTPEQTSEEAHEGTAEHSITEEAKAAVVKRLRVTTEIISLEIVKEELRFMVSNPRAYLAQKRGQVPLWVALVSLSIFIVLGTLIFSVLQLFTGVDIPILLFVLGSPIALVSAYFTARAISETGMLAGYISDMISIPAILLFRITFAAITTFMAMLGALQDSAIAFLLHLKLGQLTGVRGRDILKAVFVGTLLGTFVGSMITYDLYATYGFGGTEFPAPAAQLFGFLVVSLTGLSHFQLPGISSLPGVPPLLAFVYLMVFAIVGFLAGRELSKRGLSPISLAVGILVPPATTVSMLIGGFIDYRMRKHGKGTAVGDVTETSSYRRVVKILSGVIAGEAIVTVIWVLYSAMALFI